MPRLTHQPTSTHDAVVPFIYSHIHMAGCIGGLSALSLIHWDVLRWSWFWLLLLGYLSGCAIYIKVHSNRLRPAEDTLEPLSPSDQKISFRLAIEAQLKKTRDLLPMEARAVIVSIQQKVFVIEQKIQNQPELITEYATLTHIVFDYLPTTVDSYLKLPQQYAATKQLSSGETPNQLLIQQLKLLEQQLSNLLDTILTQDLESLVTNGRFLKQKIQPVDFFTLAEPSDSHEQHK